MTTPKPPAEPGSSSPSGSTLPRRRQLLVLAVASVVILAMIGGGSLMRHARSSPKEPAPARQAPGTFRPTKEQWSTFKVTPVERITFRPELVTDGAIAYNDDTTTPVFSPYSGRVTRLIAKPGDVVAKGAPLMAIEASEFVQTQNDLIAAVSALNTARAQLALNEANEERQHQLYLVKAGALKDWRQAQADLATAQNNLRSAETTLAAARNRLRILGKSDSEIAALEAKPLEARMNPEALVTAPIRGTVTQRQVGVGQYIASASAGASNPVFSISNLSSVWLVANAREVDAPLLRIGQSVEVRALAFPGRIFKARISWIAPAVDPNTRRVPVRAEVENPDGALKPLMFASFSIATGKPVSAVGVPQSAVVYEGDAARVFVARDDGTVQVRPIRTGRSSGPMVEVLDGLAPAERIVTSGTLFIDRSIEGEAS